MAAHATTKIANTITNIPIGHRQLGQHAGTLMIGGAVCLLAVAAFANKLPSIRQASGSFDEARKQAGHGSS